ncbi:MAG: hypothetical protein JNK15_03015 [Planctomycetes bacterium]|nr:hypothetical protein [Planctomycetota bacterium]
MKLDDLRPCDACGGPVNPVFFRLRVDQMVVNQAAVRERVGLAQFFGGNDRLASVFDARGDTAVAEASQQTLNLCCSCFCGAHDVAAAWEKVCKRNEPEATGATS